MNPETKFEFELTTEPEISSEWAAPLSDSTDWDSLKDVPFAGDLLDETREKGEIPETDHADILDKP